MKKLIPSQDPRSETASADYIRALEADVLARTLWGEARGEGALGMQAVAAVILNRVAIAQKKGRFWWGNTILQVCQKPYQFSCWNKLDPNFKKIADVDERDLHFATALRIARRAVIGIIDDPTQGATHYHASGILPNWASGTEPCARIGHHLFYRLEV
jgi:spore germination cell wall hydrolase CwlJ-like protein